MKPDAARKSCEQQRPVVEGFRGAPCKGSSLQDRLVPHFALLMNMCPCEEGEASMAEVTFKCRVYVCHLDFLVLASLEAVVLRAAICATGDS